MTIYRIAPAVLLVALLAATPGGGRASAPQSPSPAPAPVLPIAEVLADRDGDTIPDARGKWVRVRGVVTIPPRVLGSGDFHAIIQDRTAGVALFRRDLDLRLAKGDVVEASGKVAQFKGAVQLTDAEVRRLGSGTVPAARPVPLKEAAGGTHMGLRVRVEGLTGDFSLDNFATLRLHGEDGTSLALFVPASVTDRFDWSRYARGSRVAATGVVSVYKRAWPYDRGFQLQVIAPEDLQVLAGPPPWWQTRLHWSVPALAIVLLAGIAAFYALRRRRTLQRRASAALAVLSATLSLPDAGPEQLAREACRFLIANGIIDDALVLVFNDRGELRQVAAASGDTQLPLALEFRDPLLAGTAVSSMGPDDVHLPVMPNGLACRAIHPLVAPSGSQGLLIAVTPRARRPGSMQERTLRSAVAMLALALERSRSAERDRLEWDEIQHLVITDELTKLYNRRFLHEYLRVQIPLAQRHGKGLTFLAIDIDHFKLVNDTWGHDIGDRVLAAVAAAIRDAGRSSDLAVRLGGEEFLAVIAESNTQNALAYAERLRASVEAKSFADLVDGRQLAVTVSIGVALFGVHGTNATALLRASDEAMYASKRGGRNRVSLATEPGDVGAT